MRCLERCPECPGRETPLPGDGPKDADIIFIGEAPGKDERVQGKPFVGRAGLEFNKHYLPLAGQHRDYIYITNSVKCFIANSSKKPSESLIRSCADFHLKKEIERINPQIIVPMGGAAADAIGGYKLDLQHGIPLRLKVFGRERSVIPTFHPALGLHKTDMIYSLREDFMTIRKVYKGQYRRATDPCQKPHYARLKTLPEVRDVWRKREAVAVDTETYGGVDDPVWCATFSQDSKSGYLVSVEDESAWEALTLLLGNHRKEVIMHNALFDHAKLIDAGINIPWKNITDTMVLAYHLANLPKGLKALSWRLLGIRMSEFEEVVLPAWEPLALDWYQRASEVTWPKPSPITDPVTGKVKRPHGMNTKLKTLWTTFWKNIDDEEKRMDLLYSRAFDLWSGEEMGMIEEKIGEFPRPSITQVEERDLLQYACTDSRATWALRWKLEELSREVNKCHVA